MVEIMFTILVEKVRNYISELKLEVEIEEYVRDLMIGSVTADMAVKCAHREWPSADVVDIETIVEDQINELFEKGIYVS